MMAVISFMAAILPESEMEERLVRSGFCEKSGHGSPFWSFKPPNAVACAILWRHPGRRKAAIRDPATFDKSRGRVPKSMGPGYRSATVFAGLQPRTPKAAHSASAMDGASIPG
jgi:hypothetical protein